MVLMATALLQPFDNSGVYGELTFVESNDGDTLTVFGTATGLRRTSRYVSMVHGLYSNADLDPPYTMPGPCMPDGPGDFLIGPQPTDLAFRPTESTHLLLGCWRGLMGIRIGASRILRVAKPTTSPRGMHLYEMHTVSIREAVRPPPSAYRKSGQELFSLSACGQIRRTP
ncbi:MAG: hypothetical protein ACRDTG_32680 [Pseudonocardiaceae bacterium]